MTVILWCLLILVILPLVLAGVGGYFRSKTTSGFDNDNPRIQYAQLEGVGARAWAAQQNAWEALMLFIAAIAAANFAAVDPAEYATIAMIYVVCRLLHPIFYLANISVIRSVLFVVCVACCLWIFRLALTATPAAG